MIKKVFLAIMIALPAMGFAQKFGTIDTQALITSLPDMKDVQTQLEASQKKYQDEFNNLQAEIEKKYTEYQALEKDANTPETIKERRMQEIQELGQKIQQFQQTASQDLERQQQQLMAPIQQKVITAIQSVGSEGAYTMIFENAQPLYVGKDVEDLTPKVKAKLGVK